MTATFSLPNLTNGILKGKALRFQVSTNVDYCSSALDNLKVITNIAFFINPKKPLVGF